ncbi:hypothetical protein DERF_015973 [Dermatophagoides farinae]|uniref:Uncharacterized protein n=1 Tax=Dermatophagoides farinae TaxID=6954 RepID=A0A922HLR8_DERFA|nr:hypothetical protein DERF_015973 [Dermatophagoides farinae]
MGSNLCEYIQDTINIQYLIRQLLRMANDQTDCLADDCMDDGINNNNNNNQIENNLRQVDHGIGSTSLTFGYLMFTFLLIWMVLPRNYNPQSQSQQQQQRNRRNNQSSDEMKKSNHNNDHNDNDHGDPGLTS